MATKPEVPAEVLAEVSLEVPLEALECGVAAARANNDKIEKNMISKAQHDGGLLWLYDPD